MLKILILFLHLFFINNLFGQEDYTNRISPEWTVQSHRDQLKLTLIIDSVVIGKSTRKLNFQKVIDLTFESDYLHVADDIFIKIFISRSQEYGKKFYSWKWDFLKKQSEHYKHLNIGYYSPMNFNQPLITNGNYGTGIGTEGESDFIMIYYRYSLK